MLYSITVKPNSKKGPLIEKTEDGLIVFLRTKPHDGEANADLIKLLSKTYKIPKTSIIIKSGQKSHHKLIEMPIKN